MKFYNREKEIEALTDKITNDQFEFIYLLGKRRIGKTSLIEHIHTEILNKQYLYVFTEKTDLKSFLDKLEKYIYQKTDIKYSFDCIEDFLDFYFNQEAFDILVIDEFQNFRQMDESIFSVFQKKVDEYQNNTSKKLIVLGSIQSMMVDIFENRNEPLYKRGTYKVFLEKLDIDTQIEILKDIFGDEYNHKILLDMYSIFDGVPHYLKLLFRQGYDKYDLKTILSELFFDEFAVLKNEGREVLIEEFGKKHKRFFSILKAISNGKNKRNEIIDTTNIATGSIDHYLKELRKVYDIIKVQRPIFWKDANVTKYLIKDNFFNFWFRYIYSQKDQEELGLYDLMLDNTLDTFRSYQWFKFEKLVKEYLILQNQKGNLDFVFTKIGTWLDRKNNEIDLVYTDEKENIVFLEVKLNENRINSSEKYQLQNNIQLFLDKNPFYKDKNIKKWFAIFDKIKLVDFEFIK